MVQRNSLPPDSSKTQSPLSQPYRDYRKPILWPRLIGVGVVLVLSLAWTIQRASGMGHPGFTQDCSGFAQDPVLSGLWLPQSRSTKEFTSLAAMVPRLSLSGTALATYAPQGVQPAAANLETLFGVSQYGQREIVETTFYQEARAVVLYPNVLATVAHALTLDIVEVQVEPQASVRTVPLKITHMMVRAHPGPGDEGVTAQVMHVNEPYDLALVQSKADSLLQPLAFPTALSYGRGNPRNPIGGIQAGDCVATIVTSHHEEADNTGMRRLVVGKVLAKVPVATNSITQTKLNENMFTTDLAVQPGDSGSPALALRAGKPVLVGLVSATMYPTATFTYVSRIDPLLALADALRVSGTRHSEQTLAQRKDQTSLADK